jgi:hypothetical protein
MGKLKLVPSFSPVFADVVAIVKSAVECSPACAPDDNPIKIARNTRHHG